MRTSSRQSCRFEENAEFQKYAEFEKIHVPKGNLGMDFHKFKM